MVKVFQNDIEKLEQRMKLEGKSPNTIYQYKRSWKRFCEEYSVFSKATAYAFLSDKNNNTSVNRALLNHMIQIKQADFLLPKRKKKYRKLPKVLSNYEVMTILQNIDENYKDIVRVMYETGARITEVLQIKFEDIDREKGTILVTGKGDKERLLYPSLDLIESLLRRDGYSGYVFPSERTETHVTRQCVSKKIKDVLPYVYPHMFRHTYASRVYNSTEGDLIATKELLGHENIETTSIYAKISDQRIKEAVAKARKQE